MPAMVQAFTPIATMVALFVAGLERPTSQLILAIMLIALGTAIASYGEVNLNVVGVLCMLASESFEATRLVMTQVLLVGLKFHPSECCWGPCCASHTLSKCFPHAHTLSACFSTCSHNVAHRLLHMLTHSLQAFAHAHKAAQHDMATLYAQLT